MKINENATQKIGFFTALSMLMGSVIGIGIFLKNGGIFAVNEYNGIGIIISWILGGIIALTAAISFAEVGTSLKSRSGLAGWVEKFWGRKIGYFIKMIQPLFYMGLMIPILSFFSAESITRMFIPIDSDIVIHYGIISLITLLLIVFFLSANFVSLKNAGKFSFVTTILKFLPLIVIIIWGIVFSIQNQTTGLFDNNIDVPNTNPPIKPATNPSFTAILASLPSVLFAFDSFANVGNLALDIKKPNKNVPLVISVGMISCAIFYLLVTIAQIFFAQGNSLDIFGNIVKLNPELDIFFSISLNVFITISILGVLNSFSSSSIRSFNSLIDEKILFCHSQVSSISNKFFTKFVSEIKPGYILCMIVAIFWFVVITIPSIAKGSNGTDIYVDGVSNYPTLFFFAIYGFVILGGFKNRFTKKVEVQKQKTFIIAAPIAFIGSFTVFGYQLFYETIFKSIENPKGSLTWGLFFTNGVTAQRWEGMILFIVFLLVFILLPVINFFLFPLTNKGEKINFNKEE
ncbi:MAG: APC family permease [Mycoplasmoidaceae bacterium]